MHKTFLIASATALLAFLMTILPPDQSADALDPTSTPKPIPPLSSSGDLSVVYTIPGMDDVRVQSDIDYLTPPTRNHLLDVYRPDTDETLPLVVLIHGGVTSSARFKDVLPFTSWGRLVAASGLAAVTFNWDNPKTSDLTALFDYVRANGEDLKIDPSKICIVVFSGGVDITLQMVQSGELGEIACFVGYYGGYKQSTVGLDDVDPDQFPDTLILHGARDEFFPLPDIEAYVDKAVSLDLPVSLLVHSQGVHAFDLRNDDEESRDLVKASLEFITEHLLPTTSEEE